ncbi:hypothetical protein ACJMK2_017777 [Sinanodonta woodiana]|uniref:Uncharacterized protein n=1 Tax=Sinanodonta woodiana TaxID=1069815 RepID=A0ABD3UED0_SINWO
MKFPALTLCLLLAIGSNAFLVSDLKALGDKLTSAFQTTFDTLKPTAETLGSQLLTSLKTTGSQLLSQGLQSLMFGAMNVLHGTQAPAKRNLFGDLTALFQNAQSGAHNLLTQDVDGLQRFFSGALGKLQELANVVPHLGSDQLAHFGQAVDQVVAQHSAGADSFLHQLINGLKTQVASSLHLNENKRALPVELDHLANSLLQSFTPKVEELKQVVSRFGELLKQSVQQLAANFLIHSSSLESKFSGVLGSSSPSGRTLNGFSLHVKYDTFDWSSTSHKH